MQAVRTQQKFKCDFCKKRSVRHVIELHEKRCFRNPNRHCDACDNTGFVTNDYGMYPLQAVKEPCLYCSKFDPKQLAEIEAYERGLPNV